MAKYVIKDPHLTLGGTDYSTYVESVEIQTDADDVDLTTGGSAGWHEGGQGIKRGTVVFNLRMDADQAIFDAALWTAYTGTGTLTFVVRRSAGTALGTDNPKYSGTLLVTQAGVSYKVGAAFEKSFSLPTSGAITRATA